MAEESTDDIFNEIKQTLQEADELLKKIADKSNQITEQLYHRITGFTNHPGPSENEILRHLFSEDQDKYDLKKVDNNSLELPPTQLDQKDLEVFDSKITNGKRFEEETILDDDGEWRLIKNTDPVELAVLRLLRYKSTVSIKADLECLWRTHRFKTRW
jgi:hypothetical protein